MSNLKEWTEEESLKDRIRLFYAGKCKLTEQEEKIRLRLESVFSYILKHHPTDDVAARFDMEFNGVGQRQAFYDVRDCKNIFGDARQASRTANRYLVTHWATNLYRKADIKNDFRGMNYAMKNLIAANQLDKADPDLPDLSKIQPPIQMISLALDFLNSPYFTMLSPHIKERVLQLKAQAEELFKNSDIPEIMEMLMIDEGKYVFPDDTDSE